MFYFKQRHWRALLVVAVGIVMLSLLAACSAAPVGTTTESAEPAEEAPASADSDVNLEELGSGQTEINYWNGFTGPDGAVMVSMVKQFAEENPDVTVKVQMMPWGTYFDKLAAALVAGSGGPDLMVLWHSVVPEYALPGHLIPIADNMFELGMLDSADFSPALLDAVTMNGQTWTVPLDNYGTGVYVNTDLLKKAGIDPAKPPQSQEEFLEYARLLTTDVNGNHPGDDGFDPDNVDVWGYNVGWSRAAIQPALYQWGTDIISRDDPPKVLIGSQEAKAATQFFVDLVHTYNVAPPPEGFNDTEAFANGKLAMMPNGSWMYNWFTSNDVEAILWPFPPLGPEQGATVMWSHTLGVPSTVEGDKLDATMRLIQYISDNSDMWTRDAGMPTARLSLRSEDLKNDVWTLDTFDQQFQAEGVMEFSSDRFTEVMGAVEPAWSAALTGETTVEEALTSAAERIEKILDN